MLKRRLHPVIAVAAFAVAPIVGCSAPAAQKANAERLQRANGWLREFAKGERARSQEVNAAGREISRRWWEDVSKTDLNGLRLQHGANEDVDRWGVRKHLYPIEIRREVRGKPENIESTAIRMFY